jgi:DNA-binding Lrp family transcriptional regulator
MQRELDALDLKLIDALRIDGRKPNKALAAELGVSEATIAARIRALKQSRTMKVTLQRDMYAFGYQYLCAAEVSVGGRAVDAVARDIVRLSEITSVSVLLGSPELFFSFYARTRGEIASLLATKVGRIRGVDRIETHIALDLVKHDSGLADLADPAKSP